MGPFGEGKVLRRRGFIVLLASLTLAFGFLFLYRPSFDLITPNILPIGSHTDGDSASIPTSAEVSAAADLVRSFEQQTITRPYKDHVGELGRRVRLLRDVWVSAEGYHHVSPRQKELLEAINRGAIALFPFLKGLPHNPKSKTPLSDIRASFEPGSSGIVIPVGDRQIRFAAHLINSLFRVLGCELPIQIVYVGDNDLSKDNQAYLGDLAAAAGRTVDFIDILTIFDDATLKLQQGGWAIKPFAALGSTFERVILVDADSVFLQKPEVLLAHSALRDSGALIFRDRLLWQHAYKERHEWFHSQIQNPSAALNTSLVWTEEYAEEADSGVVVVDKRRTDIVMGLLHICWQNSYAVRDELYKIIYGDKETWWIGFETSGSSYSFEKHYGAMIGWELLEDARPERRTEFVGARDGVNKSPGGKKVCSFVIAHLDEEERLLWFNGGLLKNKKVADMSHDYMVPSDLKWMVDGKWEKGSDRMVGSCMAGMEIRELSDTETAILADSIQEAQDIDIALNIPK